MSNRRNRRLGSLDFLPPAEELYDPRRRLESMVRARPELRSSFQFEGLEDRYPVKPVELKIAQEEDRVLREEDLQYRMLDLKEKETQIGLKRAERDLDLYESKIAREDAMLEQVPLARQELGSLDPRDPEYLQKRMDVINKYPVAFEYEPFVENVDKPLLFRHSRLKEGRIETGKEVTEDAFNKASMLLSDPAFKKRVESGDPISTMQARVAYDTVTKFMNQRVGGMQEPAGMVEPDMGMPAESIDPDVAQAMEIISRRPELKDEVNRRLISAGKQPIE